MSARARRFLGYALAWFAVAGCNRDYRLVLEGDAQSGADVAGDGAVDAALDAPADGGMDASPDAPMDVLTDAPPDVPTANLMAPRPVYPMSGSVATGHHPQFRWALPSGVTGARLEECASRACASVVQSVDVPGNDRGAFATDLATGVHYWRVRGLQGGAIGTTTSSVWELTVSAGTASSQIAAGTLLQDVEGDGHADLAAGSFVLGGSSPVFVFRGGASVATTPTYSVLPPSGDPGGFGRTVAFAGDVDGDHDSELLIGTVANNTAAGVAYVSYGSASGPEAMPSRTLTAGEVGDWFGTAVAGVGDVNGDGLGDAVVGAPRASSGAGAVYLFLGSATGLASAPSLTLRPPAGVKCFGDAVSAAGDVNGDGLADVLVGAPGNCVTTGTAAAFVFLGTQAAGLDTTGTSLMQADSSFGYAVSAAGDMNGDGYGDVVVGAYNANTVYLFAGGASGVAASSAATWGIGTGTQFGAALSGGGDVNGDGYGDVVVGAPQYTGSNTSTGAIYVYRGRSGGFPASLDAFTLSTYSVMNGHAGQSVALLGDVNGDGFGDLAVGTSALGAPSPNHGNVYLSFGTAGVLAVSTTLSMPPSGSGFFGYTVAFAWPPRRAWPAAGALARD